VADLVGERPRTDVGDPVDAIGEAVRGKLLAEELEGLPGLPAEEAALARLLAAMSAFDR